MTQSDKLFAAWFCFMFITIIYASFGCHDIATDNVNRIEPDTLQGVMRPYVDSLQPDTIKWEVEPEMINR